MPKDKPPELNDRHTTCSICSLLADREYASQKWGWEEDDTFLPEATASLVLVKDLKPGSSRAEHLNKCPECGTCYLYKADYEYLVNGSEDEQMLIRLTDEEAAAYLEQGDGLGHS